MKKLYLKLKSGGINTLGLDIVWENEGFAFVGFENLGVFDEVDCALQDSIQGRLVLSAINTTNRNIIGEQEFVALEFAWAENAPHVDVLFSAENISARDSGGSAVGVAVYPADYVPDPNTIEFVWR